MGNKFVDPTNGNNANNGTTMDLAYQTLEYVMETGGKVAAGDFLWIRRTLNEQPTSNIQPICSGLNEAEVRVFGWPRNTAAITQADWTNGNNTVDNVVGLTLFREAHQARYITAPDGKTYLITRIVDSNTLMIDRKYPSATVTGASGAATIQADEDYALAQAIDDSAWTIKKANWNADPDTLATINFTTQNAYWYSTTNALIFKYLNFVGSSYAAKSCATFGGSNIYIRSCLFKGNANAMIFATNINGRVIACTIEGSASGTNQPGWLPSYNGIMIDCAIYNVGDSGIRSLGFVYLKNVNLGVEQANGGYDFSLNYGGVIKGIDVAIGGTHGETIVVSPSVQALCQIENFGKIIGAHKVWNMFGYIVKLDVVAGSGDPQKRTNGADSVIDCVFSYSSWDTEENETRPAIFEHEFEADNTSKTYRYYIQSQAAMTSGQTWLEAYYPDVYDDSDEYHMVTSTATGAISARSGAYDWSQYLEITVDPATSGKVRIAMKSTYNHATNHFYIDPLPVIS